VLWAGITLAAVAVIAVTLSRPDEPSSVLETAGQGAEQAGTAAPAEAGSGEVSGATSGPAEAAQAADPADADPATTGTATTSGAVSSTTATGSSTTAASSAAPATTATSSTTAAPAVPAAPAAPATTALPSTTVGGPVPSLYIEGSPMTRFSIEVGDGVDLDRNELARSVIATLSDERSWRGRGYGFELVDSGGQFTLIVATPSDVDRMCSPLRTNGYFSCSSNGWVALNSDRWFGATSSWTAGLAEYRHYLVNHEIGHQLGQGHVGCPAAGQLAPVMMQQTKGVGACLPNGWVDP